MITRLEWSAARLWAYNLAVRSGIPLREGDIDRVEVVDLGFGELDITGLQILSLVDTEAVAVKLLILKPNQFFPQHRHPPSSDGEYPGKTEAFRCQSGSIYLVVPEPGPESITLSADDGPAETESVSVDPPSHRRKYLNVWAEHPLLPGDQYVCPPNTWLWFQAGPGGAVVWSFSSRSSDVEDEFVDPGVVQTTRIVD